MAREDLTAERVRELLDYSVDTGIFTWKKQTSSRALKGSPAGYFSFSVGYIYIKIGGFGYAAHRLAWLWVHGKHPVSEIDHVNRNKTDNRIANLREATRTENCRNCGIRPRCKTGQNGVRWDKQARKWIASIRLGPKTKTLGFFDDKDAAITIRRDAETVYFGEFAP